MLEPPAEIEIFPALDTAECAAEFLKIREELCDEQYWRILRWAWIRYGDSFSKLGVPEKQLFAVPRTRRESLMTPTERVVFSELPPETTVFQGGAVDDAGLQWCWSTKQGVALSFAMNQFGKNPRMVKGRVARGDVIAYFSDYDEEEMIIDPARVQDRHYIHYPATGPISDIQ